MYTISAPATDSSSVPRLLLRTEEAANALGISRSRLYELMRAHVIESVRIGGARRIPVTCLQSYVDGLRVDRTQVEIR